MVPRDRKGAGTIGSQPAPSDALGPSFTAQCKGYETRAGVLQRNHPVGRRGAAKRGPGNAICPSAALSPLGLGRSE